MANKTLLWVGVAGVAGVLLYEHFKKSGQLQAGLPPSGSGGGGASAASSASDDSDLQGVLVKGNVQNWVSQFPSATRQLFTTTIFPDLTPGMWSMLAEMADKVHNGVYWDNDESSLWAYLKDTYNGGQNFTPAF